jgi:integrase
MAQNGVNLGKIAEMLGHADSRTTERVYKRFTPDFLRDAANALELDLFPTEKSGANKNRTPEPT